tara:strand:- start:10211 stop:10579 length:369 start_codon:yes stop_codon:yes gene_type:complete
MSPYEALMQVQGLNRSDLPSEVQTLIKRIEGTRNNVVFRNKKTDESGNLIVSESVLQKIKSLDSEIVNKIWDFIDEREKNQIRNTIPKEPIKEPTKEPTKEPIKEPEIKKEDSKGSIGFFNF